MIGRDSAPDEDLAPGLLHDQVPDLVVSHPKDLGLDLFDEGWDGPYHSWTSRVTIADGDGTSVSLSRWDLSWADDIFGDFAPRFELIFSRLGTWPMPVGHPEANLHHRGMALLLR